MRVARRLGALLSLAAAAVHPACGSDRPATGGGAARGEETSPAPASEPTTDPSVEVRTAAADSIEGEALRTLAASREALRRLDVEGFLATYETGPDLLVVDPAGEFEGRAAFERHVRAWFDEARRLGPVYGVVTARERAHALGPDLAAAVFHWSAPGSDGPYRTLLVLRRGPRGWRIAAEHSAPVPDEPRAPAEGTAPPPSRGG